MSSSSRLSKVFAPVLDARLYTAFTASFGRLESRYPLAGQDRPAVSG
jgi:hypothetical protein